VRHRMAAAQGEMLVQQSRSMKEGIAEQLFRGVPERLCNAQITMNADRSFGQDKT
jgi:hypothetical protein